MSRVLVTGGGSGIGRSIARAFAQRGAAVTISGRRPETLEETDRLEGRSLVMTRLVADVTDEASVERLFEAPFDVVVANAGMGSAAKLSSTSLELWRQIIDINLTGVFLTFRAALRGMSSGGRLIAVASTASLKGAANVSAYTAAKHGVLGLVRSTAQEVAKHGVTCNAVCPGYTDTDLARQAIDGLKARFDISEEEATRRVVAGNPVGRLVSPEEVAMAVLYLASPEAAMVNGHALSVSGGEV